MRRPKDIRCQRLYYRNKYSGRIEFGYVVMERDDKFLFKFGDFPKWVSYDAIGTRLFFTREGVEAYSNRQKTEEGE